MVFQFIPKEFSGVESFRALCMTLKFFISDLKIIFIELFCAQG